MSEGGPKTKLFLAISGVIAAGLGVVGAGVPFLSNKPADPPAKVESVVAAPAPADIRICNDGEKDAVTAALRNYGRAAVDECYKFSKGHEAAVDSCNVDLVARRINAHGQYKWKGGIRGDDQNFVAAFSTDFSGTEMRVNVTSRSRNSDRECGTLQRAER
jgi:hypothetical protein